MFARLEVILDIYMHMNSLIAASLHSGIPSPFGGFKSGTQTPAPVTKILRWKDLEATAGTPPVRAPGIQTPVAIREEEGILTMGVFESGSDGDDSDIEDLFV